MSLICLSHSPLLYCYAREPEEWHGLQAAFADCRDVITSTAPDVIVAFISDHFNGFFMDMMPAFCVGMDATAVDDIGGFAGPLDVPHDLAYRTVVELREAGFDVAASHHMTVDHAISQTLTILTGGLAEIPVVPIFINCINKPFVPFRRSRELGAALGALATSLDERVMFVASGGMSHNPTRYYPAYGTSDDKVTAYQLTGGRSPDSYTSEQWLERLRLMHIEGAEMLVNGSRTRADIMLNPDLDRRFLEVAVEGRLAELDSWDPDQIVSTGGIGWMEMHTWLAACAANQAAEGSPPVVDFYAEMLEIGIAAGVMHAE